MSTLHDSLVGLRAPTFAAGHWLNSKPLSLTDLQTRGQPTLIHFWTSSCTNSRRTLPTLARWWQTYQHQGLVIIGIHTPALPFERDPQRLVGTLKQLGVTWPTIHDPLEASWQAYENQYWPRQLLIDATGTIVLDQIGEGNYEEIEQTIQLLLTRHGAEQLPEIVPQSHQHKLGLTCYPATPDTQLGYGRGTLKNYPVNQDRPMHFTDPRLPRHPGVALQGTWTVHADTITHSTTDTADTGYLSVVFSGFEAVFIAEPSDGRLLKLIVTLNGHPVPMSDRGADIEELGGQTIVHIQAPRPYQLIRTRTYLSPAELRCNDESGRLLAHAVHFSGCQQD